MKVKKLTEGFFEYMKTTFGIRRENIENMLKMELKPYIENYTIELEKQMYQYALAVSERLDYKKERIEYKVTAGQYEVSIVKRLLSVSIYMKKSESKYRKSLKIYSFKTLEETIYKLKKLMTLKDIIYISAS